MSEPEAQIVGFDDRGLVPAVVQDAISGDVLMLAFMNDDALRLTQATGRAHYWSRSRNALWRKGETSGHEQVVDEIRVNCEQSSVLLLVRQVGAVCHDGYPTCFYRRADPDGGLTIVRERAFDPSDVYPGSSSLPQTNHPPELDPLAEATRVQYGAYAFLRDNDLTAESTTSRRLREQGQDLESRITDELQELAGVLDGSHRHSDHKRDLILESSQVIYWVLLEALRHRVSWTQLRPDRALATAEEQISQSMAAQLLRAEAARWLASAQSEVYVAASAHSTIALVGQACASAGLDPLAVVESDLGQLRTRSYLGSYFGQPAVQIAFRDQDDQPDELDR